MAHAASTHTRNRHTHQASMQHATHSKEAHKKKADTHIHTNIKTHTHTTHTRTSRAGGAGGDEMGRPGLASLLPLLWLSLTSAVTVYDQRVVPMDKSPDIDRSVDVSCSPTRP